MKRPPRTPTSKDWVKDQATPMRAKRKVMAADKQIGDPFALFTEWSGEADERAFADLG